MSRKFDILFIVTLIMMIIWFIFSVPHFVSSGKERKTTEDQKVGNWRLEAVGDRSVILHAPNGRQIFCYEDTKGKIQVLNDTTTFNSEAP